MADFLQALDPSKLVLVEAVLSFATSAFAAPVYNLPIFLFGTLAQESAEAIQSLQAFTFLVSASIVYDIIWLAKNEQSWFIRLLTILILILKVPTALAFAFSLRQRGAQFAGLPGGFNIRGTSLPGATVWSMPGGFTSSGAGAGGYQSVDDPEPTPTPYSAAAPVSKQPANNQAPSAPGAYHSV
ncbi:hypothetical protein PHLGIDRAFT_98655 [Phlebiopsis gigantea 11061_1 CR5-6]|uniref:Uncharacterized protein n=1 Tax=Phlebiopsis gigantea (strain 11061_1 CR5-6) TaxID=745531 RepID=A0A0C3P254_PHLG1|nr:hypothetical protein PHLGIDRAFT_98655 [Phlebiopsis gigantea 11061_1 CR5-6]